MTRPTEVDERRAHARHPATIDIQGPTAPDGVMARMISRNLSLGGLYCTSTVDYPEMTRLAVQLMLPEGDTAGNITPLELEAVVVRREEVPAVNGDPRYDLALFFTNVDDDARARINAYLGDVH